MANIAHNALGQRVFKTEALYPAIEGQGSTPEEQEQSWWSQLAVFFSQWWAPQAQSAEQLSWAYAYDEEGTLIGEYGSGGANSTGSTQYIWLPTPSGPMPIAAVINGSKYAVHADHLNTPRRLTNEQGQAVWQWAYSAFGDEQPTLAANRFAYPHDNAGTTNIAPIAFNLRYPGQYYDKESGLHYNYFRSYDKDSGRYTQADPIGLRGGWNKFGYVEGDPFSHADPTGLAPVRSVATGGTSSIAYLPASVGNGDLCFNDCAQERRSCTALCNRARFDSDMPNIFGGSFQKCMRGCMPARCGGN